MIGILDSGVGGLSIYSHIIKLLPEQSTVYIGDHAYLPYNKRTRSQIRSRVGLLIRFLRAKRADCIVIARNTATVAGIDRYRELYPDIPIIGVVPVVKTASELSKTREFIVLSTPFTASSAYQKRLIRQFAPDCLVHSLGCPNLTSLVERGIVKGWTIDRELRSIFTSHLLRRCDVLVLGCTHYPFLAASIRAIVGDAMTILDSGGAVARHVQRILLKNGLESRTMRPTHEFYSTGKSEKSSVVSTLLGTPVHFLYANI